MKKSSSKSKTQSSIWIQMYFVVATLIGLILISFGSVGFIDLVLTNTVLKVETQRFSAPPAPAALKSEGIREVAELSPEDQEIYQAWKEDYSRWQEQEKNFDYEAQQRKRQLANAIALLFTGIPVFWLHAPRVFRG